MVAASRAPLPRMDVVALALRERSGSLGSEKRTQSPTSGASFGTPLVPKSGRSSDGLRQYCFPPMLTASRPLPWSYLLMTPTCSPSTTQSPTAMARDDEG